MSILLLLLLGLTAFGAHALDNGLARTPPMGWLSWERYRCNLDCKNQPNECISEKLYMAQADRMVSDGYRDAGYVYVNIDDCWPLKTRNAKGELVPDPERFPSGMKALADYMHSRDLKLGIYSDMGSETCAGYPGSKFYMQEDAQTFADWGIDSLKLDGCYSSTDDFAYGYPIMGWFLNKTGRPILYSCSWPAYITGKGQIPPYKQIAQNCNLWRNYGDIADSWSSVSSIINWFGDDKGNFSAVAGPGRWNDPDMLILGDYGLSYDQQRVQMAVWSILAAPLYMSNDLRNIKPESRDLLLNRRVIAINQDPLGIPGTRLYQRDHISLWRRAISPTGSYAFTFLNHKEGGGPVIVNARLKSLGLNSSRGYNITEVFDGRSYGKYKPKDTFKSEVNPSGVFFFTATIL